MNILITGCNGFIGSHLLEKLNLEESYHVTGISRDNSFKSKKHSILYTDKIESIDNKILKDFDVLIHTAGKAHDLKNKKKYDEYFYVNTYLTQVLAKKAALSGVKKFIYLSSTKVFGESSSDSYIFDNDSPTLATDPYGKSKVEAEKTLNEISSESAIKIVIIRLPLVYGKGVKGNMQILSKLIEYNLPIPFKSLHSNKRSMVSIDNLASLISACATSDKADGKILLVSDDCDMSTLEIVTLLKQKYKSRSLIFNFPLKLLELFGFSRQISTLKDSLVLDIQHTLQTLRWHPPQSVEEGFEDMISLETNLD